MDLLAEEIQKNGFLYRIYKRGERCLIYEQIDPEDNLTVAYEVFKRRVDKPKIIFGIQLPEREKFPGNEDFGKWAWACTSLERALWRFDVIEAGETFETDD